MNRKDKPEDKMTQYERVFVLIAKALLIIFALYAFIRVLSILTSTKSVFTIPCLSVLGSLLGGSIFLIFKHYFPSGSKNEKDKGTE